MKKMSLTLLTLLSVTALVGVGVYSANTSSNVVFTSAVDKTTTIALDSENKPTITDGSGLLNYNEYASFVYDNVQELDGGHVTLLSGGSIEKNRISKGLNSITAVFDGDLRIQTSYTEGTIDYVYTLTSGEPKDIVGNYFKILTNDGADITSLDVDFNCETPSSGNNVYDLNSYKIVNPSASELITINSFNSTYRQYGLTANVVIVDGSPELYIMMAKGQSHSVTADVLLDFTVSELSAYSKVVVTGGGELEFVQNSSNDGIKCNDFVIERGTTLKLNRSELGSSGISPKKHLQIYGNLEIRNFDNGVGLNTSSNAITIDVVEKTGSLTIDECTNGFTCWNPSTGGTTVNIAGIANIDVTTTGFLNSKEANDTFSVNVTGNLTISCGEYGFDGGSNAYNFPLIFDDNAVVRITTTGTDKAGIRMSTTENNDLACATFTGHATVNITALNGYGIITKGSNTQFVSNSTVNINAKVGIRHDGGYRIKIKDNSTVNIQSSGTGISNFQRLYVCNDDGSANNASLIVISTGADVIVPQTNTQTYFIFASTKKIWIEGVSGKTGIHLGSKNNNNQTVEFKIDCADMTFKNLSNAWGLWRSVTTSGCSVDYNSSNKITLINCGNIYNSGYNNATLFSAFNDSTVIRQNS